MNIYYNMLNYIQTFFKNHYKLLLCVIFFFIIILFYTLYMRNKITKVVVFDLDETLGEFVELGMFCDIIENYNKKKLSLKEFYEIMEIFPEFLRPNILKILSYLKTKKRKGDCDKVLIYTNNQGPKEWTQKIRKYFENKLNYNLFDQVIAAYKVNGKIVEAGRTTHDKTIMDLLKCANLPENTKICFLDDLYHPNMDNDNVYYINVEPYNSSIPFSVMAERYYKLNSNIIQDKTKFNNYIISQMNKYNFHVRNKSVIEKHDDIEISEEILDHLHNFFNIYKNKKTRKLKNKYKKNVTRKSNKQ